MKHTPGPWEWVGNYDKVYERELRPVGALDDGCDSILCHCANWPMNKADESLIVAAPDMLAVLEELCGWAQYMGGWDAAVWERAQDAITKAKGKP